MIEHERAPRQPAPGVIHTAEVLLVADDFASAAGEALAVSALTLWGLPMHPGTRRMRALVAGAVSATSPLRRLWARVMFLGDWLALEVVFLDAEPHEYEDDLMPDGAEWGWRCDRRGVRILCDHIDLRPVTF